MKAKKALGQNFLINPTVIPKIIAAAEIAADEVVLEIGPGHGVLTQALLDAGAKVFAVEKDYELVAKLREQYHNKKSLKIIHQDALWFDETTLPKYKLVANLPFNVASPLIRKFLESSNPPDLMVVMVQKEVAEKILAEPGSSARGILTLAVEFYAEAEMITTVSKNSFRPQPKVDAAVIKITPKKKSDIEPTLFFRVVKAGFAAKRQQIHNSLAATLRLPKDQVKDILKTSNIDPTKRAEDLSLEDWLRLTQEFLTAHPLSR